MSARNPLAKAFVGAVVLATALITVGLTASTDSAFSIVITPIFLRLGVDVDVKVGSFHVHASWSALPETPANAEPSTKSTDDGL